MKNLIIVLSLLCTIGFAEVVAAEQKIQMVYTEFRGHPVTISLENGMVALRVRDDAGLFGDNGTESFLRNETARLMSNASVIVTSRGGNAPFCNIHVTSEKAGVFLTLVFAYGEKIDNNTIRIVGVPSKVSCG